MESARAATENDLPWLVALLHGERNELVVQRGGELWAAAAIPPTDEQLRAWCERDDTLVASGLIDAVVVGVAVAHLHTYREVGDVVVIDDLFVEPDAREVGVGHAMIELVAQWGRARGAVGIDAVALPGSRATKNFFEAHGLVARAITVHRSLGADNPS